MTSQEQREAARQFYYTWNGRGNEKNDCQSFWINLLSDVLGMDDIANRVVFEKSVIVDGQTKYIDVYIPESKVLIEQKSLTKDLDKEEPQSGGIYLTPYQQAKRYYDNLPFDEIPRWIVLSNFSQFRIHDMNTKQPEKEYISIDLKDIQSEYTRLNFLIKEKEKIDTQEVEISVQAGNIVGLIYDALLEQYADKTNPESLKSLNKLCVRLVFCMYAEDSGLFGEHLMFHDYMSQYEAKSWRKALIDLFKTLNTEQNDRNKYLEDDLAAFPYVNGGLFAEEDIEIPRFTDSIVTLILEKGCGFDWSKISPTIFGAVFESTLNPETRRSGGMHYTSIENIHKVIDPLFLDDLKNELEEIKQIGVTKQRKARAKKFQDKLASLTFLDPAAGSGNFLTESYLSLRRLENKAIEIQTDGQISFMEAINPIRVSIGQFYGIEINDFAVTVATTALWIAEHQMMKETEDILHMDLDFLPLKSYTNIVEGNALRIDWESVVPKNKLNYIMGNPPFVGARMMSNEQKDDLNDVFPGWKNAGNLDYVCCWYKKATDMMMGTSIRAALVSTNSVSQGESVANLWKPLMESGVHIDFAHRTFRWDSEAKIKAHVHCVIIGFSVAPNRKERVIYTDGEAQVVKNINGYLIDADNISVESRSKSICNIPKIGIGNKPIDGGNYLFSKEEMDEFIKKEPASGKYFMPWYGSQEFINQSPRYCLWLGDCTPNELRRMPECMKRIEAVQKFRLASTSEGTRKLADKPTRFHVENMPTGNYILVPKVSSERRRYIPMGFMTPETLCSDLVFIIPDATLYHFGILTSDVHMAWMRAVCGRLKSDYRYSKDVVYNNFPWPTPTEAQKAKIEQTAQGILDARALFPDCSLADLYDPLTMPKELRKAHEANDLAVMKAYGFSVKDTSEEICVAKLMEMYQELTKQSNS